MALSKVTTRRISTNAEDIYVEREVWEDGAFSITLLDVMGFEIDARDGSVPDGHDTNDYIGMIQDEFLSALNI